MISLQLICKLYNIPLKMFQMISLFDGFITGLSKTDAEVYENRNNPNFKRRYNYNSKSLTKNLDRLKCSKIMLEYEPYINVKDFIGWPTSPRFGGFHIESKTLYNENEDYIEDLIVSKLDVHPNGKGHEKIAEFLYDRLD